MHTVVAAVYVALWLLSVGSYHNKPLFVQCYALSRLISCKDHILLQLTERLVHPSTVVARAILHVCVGVRIRACDCTHVSVRDCYAHM